MTSVKRVPWVPCAMASPTLRICSSTAWEPCGTSWGAGRTRKRRQQLKIEYVAQQMNERHSALVCPQPCPCRAVSPCRQRRWCPSRHLVPSRARSAKALWGPVTHSLRRCWRPPPQPVLWGSWPQVHPHPLALLMHPPKCLLWSSRRPCRRRPRRSRRTSWTLRTSSAPGRRSRPPTCSPSARQGPLEAQPPWAALTVLLAPVEPSC
mmetsp:Transcript_123594/g.384801  ORF Transcript_123594/g.384801 Transcript_123594/m.384801 type:complete len:207 (+) Transcript_123594:598-1218(+)